jgi:hypothetical protein
MKRAAIFAFFLAMGVTTNVAAAPAERRMDAAEPAHEDATLGRSERDHDRLGWYIPDLAKLQVAGYLGTVGVGLGYAAFDDVLNVSLYYGFTPASVAGHPVHTSKLAFDVRPFELRAGDVRFVPAYVGGGLLYAFGGEFFTRLPARYRRIDSRYYPPTAIHWLLQAGVEVDYVPRRGPFERHGLYYEVVALDSYAFSYFENPERLRLVDVFSSSIGYRLAF